MEPCNPSAYHTISVHENTEVRQKMTGGQKGLFSKKYHADGDVIVDFSASSIAAQPTHLTLQIGYRKHITLQPEFLQYVNHSCEPNVFFDTSAMQLIAIKNINAGDELVFFYPSAEWKMSRAFNCCCGSPACLAMIKGAAILAPEILNKYRLTDFIQQQLYKKATQKKIA